MRIGFPEIFAHTAGAAVIALMVALAIASVPAGAQDSDFNGDGTMKQPEGYREWVYVGTPLTPNELNDGEAPFPEFHSVYINPAAWATYKSTGKFPDGTVMVKELVSVGSKRASSGDGYFMGEFVGLEAAVKDSKRFPNEPGNWAYFSFGHKYPLSASAKIQPEANCSSCHQTRAADDFVFTQFYPVLRAGKGK